VCLIESKSEPGESQASNDAWHRERRQNHNLNLKQVVIEVMNFEVVGRVRDHASADARAYEYSDGPEWLYASSQYETGNDHDEERSD
jgi:hypothetical protein